MQNGKKGAVSRIERKAEKRTVSRTERKAEKRKETNHAEAAVDPT